MKSAIVSFLFFFSFAAGATIQIKTVEYKDGNTVLEGYLVYDDAIQTRRPGVVIVHDWMGNGDYTKMRATQMAELGYVALAADIYGKGIRPKDAKEAAQLATEYRSGDRQKLRSRGQAAFNYLSTVKNVDNKKMLAMGYCFGGTAVLEMARAGLPLKGVVSFHGGLATANPSEAKKIKGSLLALHGAIDPYVKPEEVRAFQDEMNGAGVDYQFVAYSGAVHGFTQKHAGTDIKSGMAYNPVADKRSFTAMKEFFSEITK